MGILLRFHKFLSLIWYFPFVYLLIISHLAIISVQSNRRSWTTKTDGSRARRESRAIAQKGNYMYHRKCLIDTLYNDNIFQNLPLFSIYEMIDYHEYLVGFWRVYWCLWYPCWSIRQWTRFSIHPFLRWKFRNTSCWKGM